MKKLILTLAIFLSLVGFANADRAYIVLPMSGGSPVVGLLTYHGFVLVERFKTTGLYMVTGKTAELDAFGAMAGATMITRITDSDKLDVKPWVELDAKPEKAVIDKLNTLSASEVTDKPVITDKETFREAMLKLIKNKNFERTDWVKDE